MKFEFSRYAFEKYTNINFHENPSNGSRLVPRGQRGRKIDMVKRIVAFLDFANEPKNS